jgi:hypothetical protein
VSDLSALNLADDFERAAATPDAARWTLGKPGPLEVLALMSSLGASAEQFQARLLWDDYPEHAPSLKFRDPATGRLDLPTAWPVVRGFRPKQLDACVNYCSEGFTLHPEWKTDARFRWDPRGNALLRVLRTIQEELDNHFQGRFRK